MILDFGPMIKTMLIILIIMIMITTMSESQSRIIYSTLNPQSLVARNLCSDSNEPRHPN